MRHRLIRKVFISRLSDLGNKPTMDSALVLELIAQIKFMNARRIQLKFPRDFNVHMRMHCEFTSFFC